MASNSSLQAINGHNALRLRPGSCSTCHTTSTAPTTPIANVSPPHSQYTISSLYFLENTSLSSHGLFIPLCRFKEWIQTTDCSTFPSIRSIHIQFVCNNTQCMECFLPTKKGAEQVRDFLPLLRFATTYKQCSFDFALPFGGTADIEPQPSNNDEALFVRFRGRVPGNMVESFLDVDLSLAGNWWEVLFVWASVKEQDEGHAHRGAPFFSVKEQLGKAMGVWERKFRELCADRRVLGFLLGNMVERIMVDVLGELGGVDAGEGRRDSMRRREGIEVKVIKNWR